ncbi:MAG TPA: HPF/RaiA family ribosome-associated protein [Gemmatimonadaceae bacterium]|nr:HPF/RaiA family ribosome-associated protein [Gemmatimonadaceae bacterium]
MEIIFHAHHAEISPRLRHRAEQALRKLVQRLGRAVDAVVRFEGDGPMRRVEVILHAPRAPRLVARGEGRQLGTALTAALERLSAQVTRLKRTRKSTARKSTARRRGVPRARPDLAPA